MPLITDENIAEVLPYFKSVFIAVFNCRNRDRNIARRAVLEKFGEDEWRKTRRKMRTGVMAIFHTPPSDADRLYAETVAIHADKRAANRKALKT